MTENDEEQAKLERATETAKRLQKLRAEFPQHGPPGDCPRKSLPN
jgi:hypothetical protein